MILKCLILDDEPLAHHIIQKYVSDLNYLEIVAQAYLPTKALEILKNQEIDLIFLDIQMPKLNGLEFLGLLQKTPQVIITTAFEEYALKSYEFQVCDYLLKPFSYERFIKATEIALNRQQQQTETIRSKKDDLIIVKSDKKLIQIALSEIYYLESYGNYVKIWLEKEYILTPRTLNSFEEQFIRKSYFRIHKSFIINSKKIKFIEGNQTILSNNMALPISKNYKKDFLFKLSN